MSLPGIGVPTPRLVLESTSDPRRAAELAIAPDAAQRSSSSSSGVDRAAPVNRVVRRLARDGMSMAREHWLIIGGEGLIGVYLSNLQWAFARWPVGDGVRPDQVDWQGVAFARFLECFGESAVLFVFVLVINRMAFKWFSPRSRWPIAASLVLPLLVLVGAVLGLIEFVRLRPYF
jgi:hypothetical protein